MDPRRPRENRREASDPRRSSGTIGPRILIPGYPQWSWRQKERALVLFGSYLTAMLVGVMTWGTAVGLGILAFAFATHAFSAADAIRQYAFPGFGRLIPAVTASAGLGAVCYGPLLLMASVYAWPITLDERPREGYFINRWAYREETPAPGDTVWLRPTRGARPKIARVVAGPGQRVEWADDQFRVDDTVVEESPFPISGSPGSFKLTIPEKYVLVTFGADPSRGKGLPGGWEIVDQADVRGRAWVRSYPIWDRRLLR
jgi:Signal peptidase, peptidase S26